MSAWRFNKVFIESTSFLRAEQQVSSAELEDRVSSVYNKLQIPFGTLEKLSGIKNRYFWSPSTPPSQVATQVAELAIEKSSIERDKIGALFSCSVSRDYFEPATAILVHHNLRLNQKSIAFDISNACIGFSDGLLTASMLIERGDIQAALVVSGESLGRMFENSISHMLNAPNLGREDLLKLLPTLTLGCGAVAYLLCSEKLASSGAHALRGIVSRTASEFKDLCVGSQDACILDNSDGFNPIMHTESSKLIPAASALGGSMREEALSFLGWKAEEIDRIICHQVGKQVNEIFYKQMGLDFTKDYAIYSEFGNMVSASLPGAVAIAADRQVLKRGDKLLLTAFGSGLNCRFISIDW
ncbi:MAG TPA: 3-oxoacyl-ACP synthase III [Oligoflexia bacterium]|nr:3-oxoacyl-ACP synthase III [Oligoflexia bacterium]HMP27564.1 3-oxoacyl-ACP synthase III [Oligoflexia bacterium]